MEGIQHLLSWGNTVKKEDFLHQFTRRDDIYGSSFILMSEDGFKDFVLFTKQLKQDGVSMKPILVLTCQLQAPDTSTGTAAPHKFSAIRIPFLIVK